MEESNDINSPVKKFEYGRILKTLGKIILWIAGIWLTTLIILQIVLSSSLLTNIVDKYAKEYIDGEIAFGKVSVSMFKHFPNVGLTLEDFSITYPSDRYDISEKSGVQGELMWSGCGDSADTLACFSRFTAGLNIPALLTGNINIPQLYLVKPRIFLHNYSDGRSNLETIILGDSTEETEDESSDLPPIKIGSIHLKSHPHIVFTDSRDSIFTVIDFKRLIFDGKIDLKDVKNSQIELDLDSMFVAGRVASDTVALGMDKVKIHNHNKHIDLLAEAKTFVGTKVFGRLMIPVKLEAGMSFPQDTIPAVAMEHFKLSIASLPIHGSADLRFHDGKTAVKSSIQVENCQLDSMLKDLVSYVVPEANKISTDAVLSLHGECDGIYDHISGKLPEFNVRLSIPNAQIAHADFPKTLRFEVKADAAADTKGKINANIEKLNVNTAGLKVSANGKANDILSDDPFMMINANMEAILDSIASIFIPDSLGISARGKFEAGIDGSAKLSQLDIYNFSGAKLSGFANCHQLRFDSPKDTIKVFVDKMSMNLGPEIKKFGKKEIKNVKLLTFGGDIDSLYVTYKNSFEVNGKKLNLGIKNSAASNSVAGQIRPLGVRLNAEKLTVKDAESSSFILDHTQNGFLIYPKKDNREMPIINVSSKNKRIFLRNATNRVILTDASIKANAAKNIEEHKGTASPIMFSQTLSKSALEDDFKKQDPDFKLDEALAKYFRDWDLNGSLKVRTGILMTPYFPLRNILRGMDVNFTNDKVEVDTLTVMSGGSKISTSGSLTGIKMALLGGTNPLKLDINVSSDKMNTNELLKAYSIGSAYKPSDNVNLEDASDSEFLKQVTADADQSTDTVSLIVIPSNIIANINLNAKNIKYSDLFISNLTSKMTMKERCVQITDTRAESNAGDISLDAFYSTKNKKNLKAGFNFNFSNITAEKVISLMPVVDSIMPMLKSFKGMLDCELAATAALDTNMNIVMPSINGILRIGGKNLTINNNEMFQDLARKLKFNNAETGFIDKMTVEGVIKDNKLEVFPFVLKMDRYTLAMSGIQNLDMSFKYHVSIVKSPIIFRLGVDLYGNNFDDMKFKIGKPKYKSANVPVFTSVINDTKVNLLKSIRGIFEKGVEAAINENEQLSAIENLKKSIGYVNAAEIQIVPLTSKEIEAMDQKEPPVTTNQSSGLAIRKEEK